MATLAAGEIYRYARLAGFSPDQAVTMTAIALAESGGNTGAHNPNGEDSRGLWQINMRAHPRYADTDLYDPLENARAAYDVSGRGANITPWTVTHNGENARYLTYRAEAEAAARMNGDNPVGTWTGTDGYGDVVPAGGVGGAASATEPSGANGGGGALQEFLDAATAQDGDAYVFGAQTRLSDPDPAAFDCSELVRWAAGQAGVTLPDGSWNMYLSLKQQGLLIPVEQAVNTPGALLFRFSSEPSQGSGRPSGAHVAISMGDGERTIEAMNPSRGVLFGDAEGRGFNYAAVIPGISDGTGGTLGSDGDPLFSVAGASVTAADTDTDGDGLADQLEARLGLDSTRSDTEGDGLSDGYELLVVGSDPRSSDSDGDGLADGSELVVGSDPNDADTNRDGRPDGVDDSLPDQDHDGLSNLLEQILGSNPALADTDGDGFLDGAEHGAGYDLLDPQSNPLVHGPLGVEDLTT